MQLDVLHHNDVIMDAIASQITSLTIVYSTIYSDADQRKHQSSASLAFVRGTGEFPAQKASNAENVSIWWRHHGVPNSNLIVHLNPNALIIAGGNHDSHNTMSFCGSLSDGS